jgi:hypothetical protein
MFTADTLIDTFTTAQKQAIKFIQNETVAKSLTEVVDTQAQTAKNAVKVGTDAFAAFATVGKEVVKTVTEAAKYDYAKQFTETFGSFAKAFEVSKK